MYYVSATDKHMSGWGRAQNRINRLVFVCDTLAQAERVLDKCKERKYLYLAGPTDRAPRCYKTKNVIAGYYEYNVGKYLVNVITEYTPGYRGWYYDNCR